MAQEKRAILYQQEAATRASQPSRQKRDRRQQPCEQLDKEVRVAAADRGVSENRQRRRRGDQRGQAIDAIQQFDHARYQRQGKKRQEETEPQGELHERFFLAGKNPEGQPIDPQARAPERRLDRPHYEDRLQAAPAPVAPPAPGQQGQAGEIEHRHEHPLGFEGIILIAPRAHGKAYIIDQGQHEAAEDRDAQGHRARLALASHGARPQLPLAADQRA